MSTTPSGNHESPKSKILKRKKARSNTPLSCKIEYYIKTNSAYFSDQSAFFTDDSERAAPGQRITSHQQTRALTDGVNANALRNVGHASARYRRAE